MTQISHCSFQGSSSLFVLVHPLRVPSSASTDSSQSRFLCYDRNATQSLYEQMLL